MTEMSAGPGLNLEFVDEALNLVRDAEANGIRLRILGSIAYRLQCPNNLHLFQDTKRARATRLWWIGDTVVVVFRQEASLD